MLKIGIVGLPNVGKSTLFKALTKKQVDISNYPFCTIEPNVGMVEVPDERLWRMAGLSHSKKTIPAVVEFVDIAGLVKGAAEGQGLGNKFLEHIRDVDAIAEVVRIFEDSDITHVAGAPDPVSDIEVIEYELILKDLETISKRMESVQRDVKAKKKGAEEELPSLKEAETILKAGRLLSLPRQSTSNHPSEKHPYILENVSMLLPLHPLTTKPIIYIFNVSEGQIQTHWAPSPELKNRISAKPFVSISAKIESELSEIAPGERREYMDTLGIKESGLDQLIKTGYGALGLITFFTTGEKETRAWTIPEGSTAPRAGRAIHSDFEEKFIRAEIIHWEKLLEAGSWSSARERGWIRTEGKDHIVKDGDVIIFKI